MMTIDLANGQKRKKEIIAFFLDGLAHVPSNAPGLQSYHAARGTVNGNLGPRAINDNTATTADVVYEA